MDKEYQSLIASYFTSAEYMSIEPMSTTTKIQYQPTLESESTHGHDDIEITYIVSGAGHIVINGESKPINAGTIIRLLPFHIHKIICDDTLCVYRCRFSLGVTMSFALANKAHRADRYILEFGCPVVQVDDDTRNAVTSEFEMMMSEQSNDQPLNDLIILSGIMRIMYYFERNSLLAIDEGAVCTRNLAWDINQYIQLNFSGQLTSSIVADNFEIPVNELIRLLKYTTGENFTQNLNRARIRNACAIMLFDDLSTKYIGQYVGYKTAANFYRNFKAIKSVTPEQYRQGNRSTSHKIADEKSWSIVNYVYDNYTKEISIHTCEKELYISTAKITQLLEENYKTTFHALLQSTRIQFSCSLLKMSDAPIADISYAVGFKSIRSFTRCFLEIMGTSASEYRK